MSGAEYDLDKYKVGLNLNFMDSDTLPETWDRAFFQANAISNSCVSDMKAIVSGRAATIELNDKKGRQLVDTWNLTDDECANVTTELNNKMRINCEVIGASIKKWYQPSNLHTDGPGATFSCIIPLDFEYDTDNWDLKDDGIYYNKNDISVTVGNTSWTTSATLPANTPHHGPGLVITEAEAVDRSKAQIWLRVKHTTSTSGHASVNTALPGTATGICDDETYQFRLESSRKEGATKHWMAECIHLPEQLRLYLYHFFRSPFPWHYGAGIFFKPYMLHCSTSWGGNGSLRYPGTGAFTSPGHVNPNAFKIGGDSSSGYTTRYGGPRHLRREGLWKGYHHFEPGISKTHLLLNVKVNSE